MTGTWSTRACGATDCSLTWSPSPSQVTGVVLLSVGLWWKFMLGPYMLLISNSPSNGPYVLIGTGVAIVLFGLFGCFATCKGRPWMLKLVRFHDFSNRCARGGDWYPTLYSLQYAVFLALVFMTELIAGISGFIFRHEVTQKKTAKRNTPHCRLDNTLHSCPSVCVQIKGTFLMTYNEAVMSYDGLDDRSLAVDGIQRRVRVGPFLSLKQMIWLILIKTPGLCWSSWFNYLT